MIFSLFWKNFKAQFHGYLVYFISMTFAVIVYYCFSAITYNRSLVARASQDVSISSAMNFGGLFIVLILLGFMLATNHFFLAKRSEEIGLYHLLGMQKSQIAFLFFIETMVLGLMSLISGLFLGIILSKLFSMILAKAMLLQIESPFYISFPSMFRTAIVFGLTLLVVSISSCWEIYRYQLENQFLLKGKEKTAPSQLSKSSSFLGVLGIFLIAFGYFLAYNVVSFTTKLMKVTSGGMGFIYAPLLILLICMLGTYFFYRNTISLVVYLISKKKKSYYRDLKMVALGNVKVRIRQSRKTLTAITIFIGIGLAMISGAGSLFTLGLYSVNRTNPTDFIVSDDTYQQIKAAVKQEPSNLIGESVELTYKLTGGKFSLKIGQEQRQGELGPINVLSLSNYQSYQKINPYLKDVIIENKQEAILIGNLQTFMGGFIQYESPVIVQGELELKIVNTVPDFLGQPFLRYDLPTIVVSDVQFKEITEGLTYRLQAFNSQVADEEALANRLLEGVQPEWIAPIYYDYSFENNQLKGYVSATSRKSEQQNGKNSQNSESEHWRLNYTSRFPELRYKKRQMGLFIYIALFLGVLSLLITGSILMLRQFSEFSKERSNYELLKRIGVPQKEIVKLIYQQNSIIFLLPMIIGILHALFALNVLSKFVTISSYVLAYASCCILMFSYIIFYLLTSAIYARMIFSKRN